MGLLDDAIRQHLELKRLRGVESDEVEREEREALGSPRHTGARSRHYDQGQVGTTVEPTDDQAQADPGWRSREDREGPLEGAPGSHVVEVEVPPEAVASGAGAVASVADEPVASAAHEPVDDRPSPEPARSETLQEVPSGAVQETIEFDLAELDEDDLDWSSPHEPGSGVEREDGGPAGDREDLAEHEEEREAGHEDLLEETPEFLQETPEHERLWFEQKAPRDFNFGK